MAINARKLRNDVNNHGSTLVVEKLNEGLTEGHLKPDDFQIRDLAEAILGVDAVREMDPRTSATLVTESTDAVDTTAFSNIIGQIVYTELLKSYEQEQYFATAMFRTVPTRLNGEKVPGFTHLGDAAEQIHEAMPYPNAGFGEDFTQTPETEKHGLIVPITKEAVFFDRTGHILEYARGVGETLGLNKEKRCIDVLIGATNTFNWRGTTYNTYNAANAPWINELQGAQYDLQDWTQIDAAERLFDDIVDPNTGEAIEIGGTDLVTSYRRKHTANRILNATEIRYINNAANQGPNFRANSETVSANPLSSGYKAYSNRRYYRRLQTQLGLTADQAAATWLVGDMKKAFKYMENWGITTVQAPVNAEAEFRQDIIAQFKASERGTPAIDNPRYVIRVKGYN